MTIEKESQRESERERDKTNLVPNVNLPELFEEGEESQLQFLAATLTANQTIKLVIIN